MVGFEELEDVAYARVICHLPPRSIAAHVDVYEALMWIESHPTTIADHNVRNIIELSGGEVIGVDVGGQAVNVSGV